MKTLGIDKLSVDERLQLIDEIWESLGTSPDDLPLTREQEEELERRLAEAEANPDAGIPWEVVKAQLEERLK